MKKLLQKLPELISFGLLICAFLYFHPRFESNDDFAMMAFAMGLELGEHVPTLVFINSIIGFLLCCLYAITDSVNWYLVVVVIIPLFYATTQFFRLWLWAVSKRFWIALLLLGTFLFFWLKYFALFQFTRSAYLLVCGASISFFFHIHTQDDTEKKSMWAPGFWIGYAFLLRPLAAASGLVWTAPLFWMMRSEISRKQLKTFMLPILLMVGLGWGTNQITMSGERWNAFHEYNAKRASVLDTRRKGMIQKRAAAKKLSISTTNLNALALWFFPDEELFSTEFFDRINEAIPLELSLNRLPETAEMVWSRRQKAGYRTVYLFAIILLFLTAFFPKRLIYSLLYYAFLAVFFLHFFRFLGKLTNRVYEPLYLVPLILIFCSILFDRSKKTPFAIEDFCSVILLVTTLFFVGFLGKFPGLEEVSRADQRAKASAQLEKSIKDLNEFDPKGFYYPIGARLRVMTYAVRLFNPAQDAVVHLKRVRGGWGLSAPFYQDYLKKNALWPHLYERMLEPNRYWVATTSNMRLIMKYYAHNYKMQLDVDRVRTYIQPGTNSRLGVFTLKLKEKPAAPKKKEGAASTPKLPAAPQ